MAFSQIVPVSSFNDTSDNKRIMEYREQLKQISDTLIKATEQIKDILECKDETTFVPDEITELFNRVATANLYVLDIMERTYIKDLHRVLNKD